jgi:hypothetical protein
MPDTTEFEESSIDALLGDDEEDERDDTDDNEEEQ